MPTPVSIILPTYNRAHTLRRAVQSVLAQTYKDFELLVVDDGSTDSTSDLVSTIHDERFRYLPQSSNRGPAAARNAGLRAARYPLVAFQDSDDEWLPGKLAAQLKLLEESEPNVGLVSCGLQRHDPPSVYLFPPAAFLESGNRDAIRYHAVAFSQTWLVRREVFNRFGPFDEKLWIWEDWEFLLRLTDSHRVLYMKEPLVISYTSPDAVSADVPRRIRSLEHILAKHGASSPPTFQARLHYLLARFRVLNGETTGARHALWQSLRLDPLRINGWAMLLLLCFGASAARAMIAWKVGGHNRIPVQSS